MLTYADDDIVLGAIERWRAERPMGRKAFEQFTQRTKKIYGQRNDAVRHYVYHRTGIRVGKYTYGFEPLCLNKTTVSYIGSFCSIAGNVGISLGNHPMQFTSTSPAFYLKSFGLIENDTEDQAPYKAPIIIDHDVWIGLDVTILTGVHIGIGAVIAAGAVVTRSVPPFAVVAGVPAKIIKYRFDEDTRHEILNSRWWLWTDKEIKTNMSWFQKDRSHPRLK